MLVTIGVISFLVISVIIGIIFLIRMGFQATSSGGSDIQSRLEEYAGRSDTPLSLEELELSQPFAQRVIRPLMVKFAEFISRFSPEKSRKEAELQLLQAGKPYNWGPKEFFAMRVTASVIFGVFGFLVTFILASFLAAIGAGAVSAGIGFMLPIFWLRSKITARQDEIQKTMPDALDLLTITVEAGMGFDGALQKVAAKWENELSKAFSKVIQEMRLGVTRSDALRNMDASIGIDDVTSFVAAIIQAEQLGVSLAKILRVQSNQMRQKRRQRAEEAANKAPIKMLFPMVFLIFPALFLILLGPAALILMETFGYGF